MSTSPPREQAGERLRDAQQRLRDRHDADVEEFSSTLSLSVAGAKPEYSLTKVSAEFMSSALELQHGDGGLLALMAADGTVLASQEVVCVAVGFETDKEGRSIRTQRLR